MLHLSWSGWVNSSKIIFSSLIKYNSTLFVYSSRIRYNCINMNEILRRNSNNWSSFFRVVISLMLMWLECDRAQLFYLLFYKVGIIDKFVYLNWTLISGTVPNLLRMTFSFSRKEEFQFLIWHWCDFFLLRFHSTNSGNNRIRATKKITFKKNIRLHWESFFFLSSSLKSYFTKTLVIERK